MKKIIFLMGLFSVFFSAKGAEELNTLKQGTETYLYKNKTEEVFQDLFDRHKICETQQEHFSIINAYENGRYLFEEEKKYIKALPCLADAE